MTRPVIVYYHQDLRMRDNPALYHAAKTKAPIIPLYIYEEKSMGAAQKWWLHHSLKSLVKSGVPLILRSGDPHEIITELIDETDAQALYWNRWYEPDRIRLQKKLNTLDIETEHFNGSLLIEPWEVKPKTSDYYKVFTPFWKTSLKVLEVPKPLPAPKIESFKKVKSESIDSLNLIPTHPNWAKEMAKFWEIGEEAALKRIKSFAKNHAKDYDTLRDFPEGDYTSRISPYLHFGEISPRQVWHAVDNESYRRELGWREFSYHLLYHFPKIPTEPFNDKFEKFEWKRSQKDLKAWQKGMTGYPIIDAGMRQLWAIGWMHNRVRMIVASFLTKDLLIHWRKGADWFWDTLVDADLANNSASWQWVAGCGADAAPYFRVFNPVLQGKKFDSDGKYVKQWIPELQNLDPKWIHSPWEAPEEELESAGITLGKDYPKPIVDHKEARDEALKRYEKVK